MLKVTAIYSGDNIAPQSVEEYISSDDAIIIAHKMQEDGAEPCDIIDVLVDHIERPDKPHFVQIVGTTYAGVVVDEYIAAPERLVHTEETT